MKVLRSELNDNPTVKHEDTCAAPGEEEFERITGIPYQPMLCEAYKEDEMFDNCTNLPFTGLPNSKSQLGKDLFCQKKPYKISLDVLPD